ncbi:hypothetical protein [Paraburkholderia dipogonis]
MFDALRLSAGDWRRRAIDTLGDREWQLLFHEGVDLLAERIGVQRNADLD